MAEKHESVELGNTSCNCSASPSSSSVYHSTRIEGLLQSKSDYETTLDFEIAASKDHWSELEQPLSEAEDSSGGEKGEWSVETNSEIVTSLRRQFPQMGDFFRESDDSLVLGKKIAEGGQAEIFEAQYARSPLQSVLKVFKEGSSVLDLQKQWPPGMLKASKSVLFPLGVTFSPILGGTVVMNGRFAFEMFRCAGDLRKLIDKRMERNNHQFCAPFSDEELGRNMYCIAEGMRGLHEENIVHRDLKASNVLIDAFTDWQFDDLDVLINGWRLDDLGSLYYCHVADYECSVGVVGTGFWRAPEILQGLKDRKITKTPMSQDLFTKEVDVYSFAMTCYEMITGRLPFEGVMINDYDVVLQGERPPLPEETEPWIKSLLSRCWHQNPKERPSFEEIVEYIECEMFVGRELNKWQRRVSFCECCNVM